MTATLSTDLSGRAALITGAGTGIGKATAERMSADGAHVIAGIIGDEERTAANDFTQRLERGQASGCRALPQ